MAELCTHNCWEGACIRIHMPKVQVLTFEVYRCALTSSATQDPPPPLHSTTTLKNYSGVKGPTRVSAQTPSPRMCSTYSVSMLSRLPSMALAFMNASISGSGLMPFSFSSRRSSSSSSALNSPNFHDICFHCIAFWSTHLIENLGHKGGQPRSFLCPWLLLNLRLFAALCIACKSPLIIQIFPQIADKRSTGYLAAGKPNNP